MRFNTQNNIAAADASVNENGLTIDSSYVAFASVQAVVTGTSTGTLLVEYSNDLPSECSTDSSGKLQPVNWTPIGTPAQVTIAGAGSFAIPVFQCCYRWIRCQFTKNNGASGAITAQLQTQGF